jgi:hypothetical protein
MQVQGEGDHTLPLGFLLLDLVGFEQGAQVFDDDVHVVSPEQKVIKIVGVVFADVLPNTACLLPHVGVRLRAHERQTHCGHGCVIHRAEGQKARASGAPRAGDGFDLGVVHAGGRVDATEYPLGGIAANSLTSTTHRH